MKTVNVNTYNFNELSHKSKEVARNKYREDVEFPYFDDYMKSIESFCNEFNITVENYNIGAYQHTFIKTNATNANFRDLKLSQFDKDLMPTGYCSDADLRYKFYDEFKRTSDALQAFNNSLDYTLDVIRSDVENFYSNEQVDESLEINEYDFTENGAIFN